MQTVKMCEKKVSIVLPVYNGEEHVTDSIRSIMSQTYQNWELIIVNDCSTDNTLQICEKIAEEDDRVRIISNGQNLKLPNSLNSGFNIATGDYYTWTSDDNMYRPEAIEILVNRLQQNPDAVMVYSDYTNIDVNGKVIGEVKLQDPEYLVTGNVCGACFIYTAEIAKVVGKYDANLFLAEDYDYWMRIYRYGKIVHVTDSLYLYRRHAGSLTETKKASICEQTYKAIEKNFLPLYVDAKEHGLTYDFFNQMIRKGQTHAEETKDLLTSINKGYAHYLNRQAIIESIKARIKKRFTLISGFGN